MDEFEFRDSTFNISASSQLNLSIQVASNFSSFALQEKADNRLVFLKHFPYLQEHSWAELAARLEKIIQSEELLKKEFASVRAMWISEKYSLVPGEYTDEHYLKKLFEIVHPLDELEELDLVNMNQTDYKLLFSLPQEIAHELKQNWANIQFLHQLIPLHQAHLKEKERPEGLSVYTQVYSNFADIIVYQNESLKLANSFPLQEKTDLIYHLLNIFNHFELDPGIAPLSIVDHYFRGISGHDSLKKYFQNTRFIKSGIPEGNLSMFQAQDISRYVNLLNLINCE